MPSLLILLVPAPRLRGARVVGTMHTSGSDITSLRPSCNQPHCARMKWLALLLAAFGLLSSAASACAGTTNGPSTIVASHAFACGANLGWFNLRGNVADGAVIGSNVCSGYIYSANCGWINLGSGFPTNGVAYQNLSAADFGVNRDSQGNLRGFAYSANLGWLNFEATGAPQVNLASGILSGSIWSANAGWISLSNQVAQVQTSPNLGPTPGPFTAVPTNLLEGPGALMDTFLITGNWANQAWPPAINTTGVVGAVPEPDDYGIATFSLPANPGATRANNQIQVSGNGGGSVINVTQAGATYVAADPVTDLVAAGLNAPGGVAVDGAGDVYIADTGNNAIKEWTAAGGLTTLVGTGLSGPTGLAVDGAGNVYIADTGDNAVKEWRAGAIPGSAPVTSLAGLHAPAGVAVDGSGNVYIADTGDNVIAELPAGAGAATNLIATGLTGPQGVAVDGAGNVYAASTGGNGLVEWLPGLGAVTLAAGGAVAGPAGLAVDVQGQCVFRAAGRQCTGEAGAGQQHLHLPGARSAGPTRRRGGGWRGECLYRRHGPQHDQRNSLCVCGHHATAGTHVCRE